MSYDLFVFSKEAAPKTRVDFLKWYSAQTEWTTEHSYGDPAITSTELKNWFVEMINIFPAMSGPYANDEDYNEYQTDYSIGRHFIYAAFDRSVAEKAFTSMLELGEKYDVGFFDVSSANMDIFFPDNGKFLTIENHTTILQQLKINKNINLGGYFGKPAN